MYAALRRYEGVTDAGEGWSRVSGSFMPLISKLPGLVAYYWIDAGGGVMASMSLFEDRAGAEESVKVAAEWIRKDTDLTSKSGQVLRMGAASLFPNPPQVTVGEVVASATS
jgi:hypothetical protein